MLTLLLMLMPIATASAVYNHMYMTATPISVESPEIRFVTGADSAAAGASIGTNGTYVVFNSIAGWPNATKVYEEAVGIQNPVASPRTIEIKFDSWSGDTTGIDYMYVKIFNATGDQQGSMIEVGVADSSTGEISIPASTTWRVQLEIKWQAGVASSNTVSVALVVYTKNTAWKLYHCRALPVSCETPKVVLQSGTAGTSTIYTNNTSAKVSVAAPRDWWSFDYDYRRQISIVNNVASTLDSGYSVCLTVNTTSLVSSGKMLPSGNDLRIVHWNGTSWIEIDRDIIDMNTGSTQVWFKTRAHIPASGSDNNYYMYHGNPSAVNPPANKSNVYVLWDDFNDGDYDGWTPVGSTWTASSGFLDNNDASGGAKYIGKDGYNVTESVLIKYKGLIDVNRGNLIYLNVPGTVTGSLTGNGYCLGIDATGDQVQIFRIDDGSRTSIGYVDKTIDVDVWYDITIIYFINGTMSAEVDGSKVTVTDTTYSTPFELGTWCRYEASYDDVMVRKYVSPEPSTYTGSEERNIEDYVDNNTYDVDSSPDKGTHSNFSAQQYGPDSLFDILTEEDTLGSWGDYASELLINSGAEFGNTTGWTAIGPNAANFAAGYDCPAGSAGPHTGSYAFYWNNPSSSSDWAYQEVDLSPWLLEIQSGEAQITAKGWLVCSEYHIPPWDIVRMKVVFYDNSSQEISSDTYDTGARGDLQVWTEFGIENYMIPTNAVKVRMWFQTFENNWDAGNADDFTVKVRTYNRDYELDLEVQWTNVDYTGTNEELCIKTGTMDAEDIKVDVWNGSAWITVFTDLTANSWSNVSVSSYLTSSNFTIRFKGGNETDDTTQNSWNIDATLLHVWTTETYDYVLKVVNQVVDNWTVNLKVYDSSNIERLSSLNISLHDGTSSNQIAVSGGSIVKSEGEPYNLTGGLGSTVYISMSNVQASTSGTSYIYIYLKILVPGISTYNLFVITFEIT